MLSIAIKIILYSIHIIYVHIFVIPNRCPHQIHLSPYSNHHPRPSHPFRHPRPSHPSHQNLSHPFHHQSPSHRSSHIHNPSHLSHPSPSQFHLSPNPNHVSQSNK